MGEPEPSIKELIRTNPHLDEKTLEDVHRAVQEGRARRGRRGYQLASPLEKHRVRVVEDEDARTIKLRRR